MNTTSHNEALDRVLNGPQPPSSADVQAVAIMALRVEALLAERDAAVEANRWLLAKRDEAERAARLLREERDHFIRHEKIARERVAVLEAALLRAQSVAEHLWQMVDRETWRDSGAFAEGIYEGEVHADQVRQEIESWAVLAGGDAAGQEQT